jgi:hypothetical protein
MDIDELRDVIWDHLFRAKASKSIDEIAVLTNQPLDAVRTAVNHEWFNVSRDRVSIAYGVPAQSTFITR